MRWIVGVSVGLTLCSGAGLGWAKDAAPGGKSPATVPSAPPAQSEGTRFFESRIRPLLIQQCQACHGDKLQKGGLRLDTSAGLNKGGETGAVVVAGDPAKSALIQAVHYTGPVKMPPAGKLKSQQIADLTAWIQMGAPWGFEASKPTGKPAVSTADAERAQLEARRAHWSFQPVHSQQPPSVRDRVWGQRPIDAFVLSRLEAKGLKPSAPAAKRELIRRAYFDVIGLPPSPEDVDRFLTDSSPDAYERLLDRLLAMPQFGERWGRHWLDVVRYAQTNGYERDDEKPHAWRFRDYVIKSFNDDKPYDLFIKEQIAGDELDQASDESISATAFYRLGVWDDEPDDPVQAEFDNLDDVLATTGQAFMGLTIGCARCHDHKFDPVAQQEYYSLLAFMRNVKRYVKHDDKAADGTIFATLKDGGKTLAVHEYGVTPLKTQILIRGNAETPGAEVQPGFVRALGGVKTAPTMPEKSANGRTTGRRRVLAEWIASPEHPTTSRVMVNRIWQHLFGRGIVSTPNDLGHTGVAPTHPELLDYLASDFTRSGWRVKRMIKEIMLSATYRQSSRSVHGKSGKVDPANSLLWRQNLRRLEAEAIRDNILATSGKLNLQMGGRGIFPVLAPEVLSTQSRPGAGWGTSTEPERGRRSVYIFMKRTLGVPFLETFDATTPDSPVGARAVTTIAPQALVLLNSTFMDEQAAAFAERLSAAHPKDTEAQIRLAFRLALARQPTDGELGIARTYLARQRATTANTEVAERKALGAFCKLVLNLNEFIYID